MFGELYDVERQARLEALLPEAIKKLRQEKSKPILDKMLKEDAHDGLLTIKKQSIFN